MGARPIVVVLTSNVALQRQIVEADLPIATDAFARAAGRQLRVAMRVGKQQVIDAAALDAAVEASSAVGGFLTAVSQRSSTGQRSLVSSAAVMSRNRLRFGNWPSLSLPTHQPRGCHLHFLNFAGRRSCIR